MKREPAPRETSDAARPREAVRSPALEWVVAQGAVDSVFERVNARLQRRRQRRAGLAVASVMIALCAIVAWRSGLETDNRLPPIASGTIHPAPRQQVLADGSVMDLRDGARATVAFDSEFRRVVLIEGEAHFAVAKDSRRPFVVVAGGVEVRAVGTAFAVQLSSRSVEVLVTEGRVAVERSEKVVAASRHRLAQLDAGTFAVVDLANQAGPVPVQAVSPAGVASRLAWRVPRLEFASTPLAKVVELFNQQSRVRLTIADPELEGLELSGVIRADNVHPLLQLLRAEFGIEAEIKGNSVLLRRKR